ATQRLANLAAASPAREQHPARAFGRVEREYSESVFPAERAQDVRRADVAAAVLTDVADARRASHEQAAGDRPDQVRRDEEGDVLQARSRFRRPAPGCAPRGPRWQTRARQTCAERALARWPSRPQPGRPTSHAADPSPGPAPRYP